jgi:DNA-binding response OmpR family regulator
MHEAWRLCLACESYDPEFCSAADAAHRIVDNPAPLVVVNQKAPLSGLPATIRHVRQTARGRQALTLLLVPATETAAAIELLNEGLDAFLVKPFGLREFVARVNALRRRHERLSAIAARAAGATADAPLRICDLEIDLARRTVRQPHRRPQLTEQEFQLLYFLASHPGHVFTREALVTSVWGAATHVSWRSVDALIKRLRQRLGDAHRLSRYVQTVRGVGYRFVDTAGPGQWPPPVDGNDEPGGAVTHLSSPDH